MICLGSTMKEMQSNKVLHLIQERLDKIIIINKKTTTRERIFKEATEDNNNNNKEIRIDRAQVEEIIKDKKGLQIKSLAEIK